MGEAPSKHSRLIANYHSMLKRIASVDTDPAFPTKASKLIRKQILQAQLDSIGIDRYQEASRIGEIENGGYDCSEWVLSKLRALSSSGPRVSEQSNSLKVLDVGSIVHRFPATIPDSSFALNVSSIDLNPCDPDGLVERADFFDFSTRVLSDNLPKFDVVVLSLVLNFVGKAEDRGKMLLTSHKIANPGALLFIVLPLAAVKNSRYCSESLLFKILESIGWQVIDTAETAKLFRLVCKSGNSITSIHVENTRKKVLKTGPDRNNFCILIPGLDRARGKRSISTKRSAKRCNATATAQRELKMKESGGIVKRTNSNQRKRARRRAKRTHHAIP